MCKFLEVSKLSFLPEYGPKLKENYVMIKHLLKVPKDEEDAGCCICYWSGCCKSKWQKVNNHHSSLLTTFVDICECTLYKNFYAHKVFCLSESLFIDTYYLTEVQLKS